MTTPPQPPQPPQQPQPYGPGGYGQAGHFGQPGGYVPPPPPKPRRSPLPWLLAGGGVVVVAIVVVLIVVLTGGDDTSSAKSVNDAAVQAVNDKDVDALKDLLCNPQALPAEIATAVSTGKNLVDLQASSGGDPAENGDSATSTIHVKVSFAGNNADVDIQLALKKQDSGWCIDSVSGDLAGP